MIQLNKINSAYFGKVNLEVGKQFDLNSEFFVKRFFDTRIVEINIINFTIKRCIKNKINIFEN